MNELRLDKTWSLRVDGDQLLIVNANMRKPIPVSLASLLNWCKRIARAAL